MAGHNPFDSGYRVASRSKKIVLIDMTQLYRGFLICDERKSYIIEKIFSAENLHEEFEQ
jgi:hypothetical protein